MRDESYTLCDYYDRYLTSSQTLHWFRKEAAEGSSWPHHLLVIPWVYITKHTFSFWVGLTSNKRALCMAIYKYSYHTLWDNLPCRSLLSFTRFSKTVNYFSSWEVWWSPTYTMRSWPSMRRLPSRLQFNVSKSSVQRIFNGTFNSGRQLKTIAIAYIVWASRTNNLKSFLCLAWVFIRLPMALVEKITNPNNLTSCKTLNYLSMYTHMLCVYL